MTFPCPRSIAALLGALALAGCATAADPPAPDPAKPHHTRDGFRNTTIGNIDKPLGDLLRWRWQAWRGGLPPAPLVPTPVVLPELAKLKSNAAAGRAGQGAQASVTWIGHATVLVQSGGLNVLADPVFSERASPFTFIGPKRAQPPGVALDDLPPVDVVIVSHNHYDHLDRLSVVRLNERGEGRTLFLVPLGNKAWMEDLGIRNVVELDWWQQHAVRGVQFTLVPVQHWSARTLGDRNRTLWGGWAVRAPGLHWYFSGDTGYSRYFNETRERLGPFDLALLAIGAYEPRWFMAQQHMNPTEAVQAHRDLQARRSIGIHWGTFELTDEPLDQPPRDLAQARQAAGLDEAAFFTMKIGQTWWAPAGEARQSTP
jgi:N-acyl-phosphatidylethanolamine-hydrolysing phospholipase D